MSPGTVADDDSRERFARKNEGAELRRAFEALDKNGDGKIDASELTAYLAAVGHRVKKVEVEDMVWEVDEDCDGCVSWAEFQAMFERCRADKSGTEPRQLFNVVQFVIHDREGVGRVTLEEAMNLTYIKYGRTSVDAQLEAVFGTTDINCGRALTLTEFTEALHEAQSRQLRLRPTARGNKGAAVQEAAAKKKGVPAA